MSLPNEAMKVAKINEDEQLVFGWASVSADVEGRLVVDSHGDVIFPEELEKAAYEYVLFERAAGERHEGGQVGSIVESVVLTQQKAEAMGIDAPYTGWWIGVKIDDPEIFAKVKSGEYEMFSIEGTAFVEEMETEGLTVIDKQLQSDVFRALREAGQERWGGGETHVYVDDFDLDAPYAVFCVMKDGEETMVGVTYERSEDGSVSLGADEAEVTRQTTYRIKPAAQLAPMG